MRRLVYGLTLLALAALLLTSPRAGAQEAGACPDGFVCPTDDPAVCLSHERLDEHEQDLADCRDRADRVEGRLEECRDAIEPLQVRIEELAASKARAQAKRDAAQAKLQKWYRKPLPWIGIGLGLAGSGYLVGVLTE